MLLGLQQSQLLSVLIKDIQVLSYEEGNCALFGCFDPRLFSLNLDIVTRLYPNQKIVPFISGGASKGLNERSEFVLENIEMMVEILKIRNFVILNHRDCKAHNLNLSSDQEILYHVKQLCLAREYLLEKYNSLNLKIYTACIPTKPGVVSQDVRELLVVQNHSVEVISSLACA